MDDDPIIQFALANLFKNQCQLTCLSSGLKIHQIDLAQIDLILMDLNMPDISGIETTKLIRKYNQTVPIIGITAQTDPNTHKNCILAGMQSVIVKPITADIISNLTQNFTASIGKNPLHQNIGK